MIISVAVAFELWTLNKLSNRFQSGVLNVHIVEAKGLVNKDIAVLGKSDPYATIDIRADGEAQMFKTEVCVYFQGRYYKAKFITIRALPVQCLATTPAK